ncbi:MAG: molybdopterin-containing oxidoreductase family protein [Candidatus Acidiferrales bacterium]
MATRTEIVRTTCPMDCPDTCGLEVTVANGRIEKIGGTREHAVTAGFICDKVAQFARRVYHEERLLHPMRRTGPKGDARFTRITWDEAIAEIAARFADVRARWGGEAILPYHYGGSNGFLNDGLLDDLFFARLGASQLARTLCAAPATAVALGMYGKMPGVAFEDYPRAQCIIIWGANPKASNIHLVPFLKQARRNGAFIAIVDPRRNFSAGEFDLHLPVYPGGDLPLALAMIRLWHERGLLDRGFLAQHANVPPAPALSEANVSSGRQSEGLEALLDAADQWPLERAAAVARVPAADIERLAETYAAASPALIRCGWGLERNRNGGQAIAAILAMPALLGKFGVPGGGYTLSNSGGGKLDTNKILGDFAWRTREINMTQLGMVLAGTGGLMNGGTGFPACADEVASGNAQAGKPVPLDPPVKALFVYNCNPAATVPDQQAVLRGLAREDLFTVVHEQVMTDTARYADIVLPATTFLEHHDIRRGYGAYVAGGVQPAIAACGEAKPNEEVFALLGRAMGLTDAPFTWDSLTLKRKTAEAFKMAGRTAAVEPLLGGGIVRYDFPGELPVQFATVMPQTPDGKIHFAPAALGSKPFHFEPVASERYPLALISPATSKMVSSTFGEFNFSELRVMLHPRDAAARGIREGDAVRVFNEFGEVRCRATLSERLREGVVAMSKGAWRKSSRNGRTATALCPPTTGTAGGACFNDARVEVACD